jgi:hypothetical protein
MIDYTYFSLFQDDNIDKQLEIDYSGGTITNSELFQGSFSLEESLCSENELRFGSCEASLLKYKVGNTLTSMHGQTITPRIIVDGHTDEPFVCGKYKITSDKPTSDRMWREIEAYDAMYDIINSDVASWYNSVLPDSDNKITLKEFRNSFANYFNIEQEDISLVNDNMIIERTVEPETLSGKDVITAICEINGCFGHIGRNGKLQYIYLPIGIQGLYPANDLYPSDDLYPMEGNAYGIGKGLYISANYEEFTTKRITRLQIGQESEDIGVTVGTEGNTYIIQGNFLVYGKSADELTTIANNILSKIEGVIYRPFSADMKGNPCFEVGDAIRFVTKYDIVETYILKRTLKGIQSLRDDYSADGVETYSEDLNGTESSIQQLKGKTNKIERTVDRTISELSDLSKKTTSSFGQTAEQITAEVKRATEAEGELFSSISVTASDIIAEVSRATGAEVDLSSRLSITEGDITAEVSRATGAESTLSTKIEATAGGLSIDIQSAQSAADDAGSTAFSAYSLALSAENGLSSKVSKGGVVSEINHSVEEIKLKAGRLLIESGNFQLDSGGNVTIVKAIKFVGDETGTSYEVIYYDGKGKSCCDFARGYFSDTLQIGGEDVAVQSDIPSLSGYAKTSDLSSYAKTSATNTFSKDQTFSGDIYAKGSMNRTSTADPNTRLVTGDSNYGALAQISTSSQRIKHDITDLQNADIAPERLYKLPVRQYIYNLDYLDPDDQRYNQTLPGFIAEEMADVYSIAADMGSDGLPENWNVRYIIPPMLALIQDQHKDIETMKAEIMSLQYDFMILKQEMEEMKNA